VLQISTSWQEKKRKGSQAREIQRKRHEAVNHEGSCAEVWRVAGSKKKTHGAGGPNGTPSWRALED